MARTATSPTRTRRPSRGRSRNTPPTRPLTWQQKLKAFYVDALSYVRESQIQIYTIVIIFFLSSIVGFVAHERFMFFNETLAQIAAQVEGLGAFELVVFIFWNNVSAAFIGLALGFAIGIVPIINAVMNGAVLGYVSYLVVLTQGPFVLVQLLPHGIFELPAIFIALGLGLKFGGFIFAPKGQVRKTFVTRFYRSMRVFFGIIVPLLVVAAIIEGLLIAAAM